jgi:hypothetical protein
MSQYTFDDLRIRTAEYLSSAYHGTAGTSAAAVPVTVVDKDVVDRVVNDGYKRFCMEHDWVFMTPIFELTFVTETTGSVTTGGIGTFTDSTMTDTTGTHNGSSIKVTRSNGSTFHTIVLTQTSAGVFTFADGSLVFTTTDTYKLVASPAIRGEAHRYKMPEDFRGDIRGQITYGGPPGTPRITLQQVSTDEIEALFSGDVTTSSEPVAVGFRPLTQDSPSDPASIEAVFWPTPQSARTIKFRYYRQPVDLVQGTDRPITGVVHDMTLLAAIKAEAELTRHDEIAVWGEHYKNLLVTSVKRDAEQRAKGLGPMLNPEGPSGFRFFRGTVDSINGTPITF